MRAVDLLGLVGPATTYMWMIDRTPPATAIAAHPDAVILVDSARFSFSSNETDVRYTCSLDSASYTDCESPATFNGLSDGRHELSVAAVDRAGNTDPTPAQFSFKVHTTPKRPRITSGPRTGSRTGRRPKFRFEARYATRFQCRLDSHPFRRCTRRHLFRVKRPLERGTHKFAVRGVGGTGTHGPSAKRRFRVRR